MIPDATIELLKQHGAEAIRECAILWLVFSLLDQTVSGKFTVPWMVWNFCGSIAFWIVGMYIETRRQQ